MNNLKVVVVGDGGVGKSCLLISYTTNSFPSDYVPTVFDNYAANIMVKGVPYSLAFFDTAGQEDYDRLRPLCYPQTDIFLLCFAVNNRTSFENIESKWIPELTHFAPGVPIILVATKIDLRSTSNSSCITPTEGSKLASKLGAFYAETSALTLTGLKELFERAVDVSTTNKSKAKAKKGVFSLFGKSQGPTQPPPPEMPPTGKAPWINISSSSFADDMAKLLRDPSHSDVIFHLDDGVDIQGHRTILCSASDFFCHLFQVECPKLNKDSKQPTVKSFTKSEVNEGSVPGLARIMEEQDENTRSCVTHIYISADITSSAFKHVVEYLYTGLPNMDEDDKDLELVSKAAKYFHLARLEEVLENLRNGNEFLNPSIGTYLNDLMGQRSKEMFLNKVCLADLKFKIEDTIIPAHKAIVISRCGVMCSMLSGLFLETSNDQITIVGTTLDCFLSLLEYLYTDHAPIEQNDGVGIMILADQYGQDRLKMMCELYITIEVDSQVVDKIAEADVDIIHLLLMSQLHNANQLAKWCLFFISSNYTAFQKKEEFELLKGDNLTYVNENRWPPVWYLEAMEEYQNKYSKKEKTSWLRSLLGRT